LSPPIKDEKENNNKSASLVQQPKVLTSQQTKQLTILPTIPESPKQSNHNDCFIEAHNRMLDELQAVNHNAIRLNKERRTMVDQVKRMITIETVSKQNTKSNNNENNNNNENIGDEIVISSKQVPITRIIELKTTENMKTSVPESRRIVQKSILNNASTDTIKRIEEDIQKFDQNTNTGMKAHEHKVTENVVHNQGITDTIEIPLNKEMAKEQKIE
jgi:hypothetical protein